MTTDQLVILAEGVTIGVDACLLAHFGRRIWDNRQALRAARQAITKADARDARLNGLAGGEQQ